MTGRSESRQKTKMIGVRATPEEKAALQARARVFGISMGELCRQTLFGAKPTSKTDKVAISELAVTRADLGRVGGLLKGWLSGAFDRATPGPQTHADVVKLLHTIDDAQKQVVLAVKKLDAKS